MMGIIESININGLKYDMRNVRKLNLAQRTMKRTMENFPIDLDNFKLSLESETNGKKDSEEGEQDQRQASHVLTIKFENGQSFTASTAGRFFAKLHTAMQSPATKVKVVNIPIPLYSVILSTLGCFLRNGFIPQLLEHETMSISFAMNAACSRSFVSAGYQGQNTPRKK